MKCRGKARGIKSRQGHGALASANQIGNTTGADGTEEHAAAEVSSHHIDPWPARYRANGGEVVGRARP